ncbi:MAG: hypothetical protein R3D98_04215 [Candidatus Krumholzibacteriia bacterium]
MSGKRRNYILTFSVAVVLLAAVAVFLVASPATSPARAWTSPGQAVHHVAGGSEHPAEA